MKVTNINSLAAFTILQERNDFYLIDVRTENEWSLGLPNVKNLYQLSWMLEDFSINQNFAQDIKKISDTLHNFNNLLFLCKSGKRSNAAAKHITEYNIYHCYDITDGFEGWKNNNLPVFLPNIK